MRRLGKIPNPLPIPRDQRFLLRHRPILHPPLELQRLVTRPGPLAPHQLDRPPPPRPVGALALLMLPQPLLEVVGMPRIIGPVAAAQDVDPELHRLGAGAPLPFDFAQESLRS